MPRRIINYLVKDSRELQKLEERMEKFLRHVEIVGLDEGYDSSRVDDDYKIEVRNHGDISHVLFESHDRLPILRYRSKDSTDNIEALGVQPSKDFVQLFIGDWEYHIKPKSKYGTED